MYMYRPPTNLIRRLIAGAAAATLGLTGLAVPAHAATSSTSAPIQPGCVDNLAGLSRPPNLLACTTPTFAHPWYVRGNQSQTADVTITNETPYTLSVKPQGGVSHAPGGIGGVDHFTRLTLRPHGQRGSAVTFPVTMDITGPVTNQIQVIDGESTISFDYSVVATGDPNGLITAFGGGDYPAIDSWAPGTPHIWSFTASAAAASEHVGAADKLTVTNNGSNTEWFELCQSTRAVAAGMHAPGTSLVHSVVESSPGTATWTVEVGTGPSGCNPNTDNYLETQAIHIDWTGQPAPRVPTDPAPALVANAVNPGPSISSTDPIYVTDTSEHAEWLEVCTGGRAVSAGFHQPGTSLVYGARSARAGTVDYSAYPGLGCSGTPVPVSVDWASGATTSYAHQIFADAAVSTPTVGTDDPAYAINTSGHGEWMTVCYAGHPLASGFHPSGGYLEHALSSSTSGQSGYDAFVGRACRGLTAPLTLRWQS